jgi:sulfatase maturation enzyme AslB (radical SAM superfamily)
LELLNIKRDGKMASAPRQLITRENVIRGLTLGFNLLKIKLRKIPVAVNYDLTWNCNLRCKHCYFFSSAKKLNKQGTQCELSDDIWLKVFNYHRELGIFSAALTGGEPTLRMNLLHKAVKIFPSIQIASNGIIKMPYFKSQKQPIYWVSLDGGEKIHNSMRGANIFRKVIDNIYNDKRVLISTTVSALNYTEIEKVVKIAYDSGVLGLFFLWYTGYPNDPLLLSGEIQNKSVKSVLKVMRDYGDFILMSKKMLELYVTKEFIPHCIFLSSGIKSYYPNGQRKFCVMGNSQALCENCGCIVPVASYALTKFDSETIDKLKKFPF